MPTFTLINNSEHKALTTLARAKAFLDISGDSKDALLTLLINQATGFIENYLNRRLLQQTYTNEEYDGTGGQNLVLKNFPVTALSNLAVNTSGDASAAWQTINSNDYFWYENGNIDLNSPIDGFLEHDAGSFLPYPKKYRATYVAGYKIDFDNENTIASHTLPQDIEYACLKLISGILNSRKGEGLSSAKVGDISMTFRKNVMADDEVKDVLGKYEAITI